MIFFSVANFGNAGNDGMEGIDTFGRSGVKRFTVAQAERHRATAKKDSVDLEKKFMNEKQIRMMNAASTSDKANVLPVVIPSLGGRLVTSTARAAGASTAGLTAGTAAHDAGATDG